MDGSELFVLLGFLHLEHSLSVDNVLLNILGLDDDLLLVFFILREMSIIVRMLNHLFEFIIRLSLLVLVKDLVDHLLSL
jgi:hypothetical protein